MPIDFAEHHVAGEDHHFGRGLSLVGDGQCVAGFVEAEAADEPSAIEVAAVGHAGVQAVAHQVVDLVDVERPGEQRREKAGFDVVRAAGNQVGHVLRIERPIVAQGGGDFAFGDEPLCQQFVVRHSSRRCRSSIG